MDVANAHGRKTRTLLLDPVFGPFFVGRILSTAGVWVYSIVTAILAFDLSGSALVVGLVGVAQFGPQLVLAPLSGVRADTGSRRNQLIAGRLFVAAGSSLLASWIWLSGPDGLTSVAPIMLTSVIVGVGFAVIGPAQNALIPSLVPPDDLAPAITLNTVPPVLARAAGPAIGAAAAVSVGPAVACAIAAATNVIFAGILWTLKVAPRTSDGGPHGDRSFRAGLRYLRTDPRLVPLLLGVAAIGIGGDPPITLAPSLAASYGGSPALVGVLTSAFGVGAVLAFPLLPPVRRLLGLAGSGTLGLCLLAAGIAATGVSPSAGVAAATIAVAGAGVTIAMTSLSTQLLGRTPDMLRGRIMALWSIAFVGSRPFAAAANGAIADAIGLSAAFAVSAVAIGAAAWLCRPPAEERADG